MNSRRHKAVTSAVVAEGAEHIFSPTPGSEGNCLDSARVSPAGAHRKKLFVFHLNRIGFFLVLGATPIPQRTGRVFTPTMCIVVVPDSAGVITPGRDGDQFGAPGVAVCSQDSRRNFANHRETSLADAELSVVTCAPAVTIPVDIDGACMVAACGYFDELLIPGVINRLGIVNSCRRFLLVRVGVITHSTVRSRTPTQHVALGLSDRARETTTRLKILECVTTVHFLRGIGVDH